MSGVAASFGEAECSKFSMRRLRIQPPLHMGFQHAQRNSPIFEHGIMKFAHIEFRAESLLRFRAQLANFHLSDLVRQSLARPHDVAIHFYSNVLIGLSGILAEEIDRLLPRPAHGMHPGFYYEPHRAPHLIAELPEFCVWILIHAELFAEAFRIKPPALNEGRVTAMLSEFRLALLLLREGNLQMMSRN